MDGKSKVETPTSYSHDIKVLVILFHIVQTRGSWLQEPMVRLSLKRKDNIEVKMLPLANANDECIKYPIEGEVLVMKRSLNMHVKLRGLEEQRENIFHTRCHV